MNFKKEIDKLMELKDVLSKKSKVTWAIVSRPAELKGDFLITVFPSGREIRANKEKIERFFNWYSVQNALCIPLVDNLPRKEGDYWAIQNNRVIFLQEVQFD